MMPFATPEEKQFADIMARLGIQAERPEKNGGRVDFYLPTFDMFVEIKQHPCERLPEQMESCGANASVMVLCGPRAVYSFGVMLDALMRSRVLDHI